MIESAYFGIGTFNFHNSLSCLRYTAYNAAYIHMNKFIQVTALKNTALKKKAVNNNLSDKQKVTGK